MCASGRALARSATNQKEFLNIVNETIVSYLNRIYVSEGNFMFLMQFYVFKNTYLTLPSQKSRRNVSVLKVPWLAESMKNKQLVFLINSIKIKYISLILIKLKNLVLLII